jgi:hypothetical protein
MISKKIKPCPFCGQEIDITDEDFCYPNNRERTEWRAGCIEIADGCGAEVLGCTEEEAINKWNNRVKK